MASDLTVLTVVENDPDLLQLMIKSVLKFSDFIPEFIICDNTNGKNRDRILSVSNGTNVRIIDNKPKFSGGSNRHSSGLNKIFSLVETKYTAIIESDVVVLHKNWYKIKSGYHSKASLKNNKEQVFHMCFFIAETNKLWRNNKPIDFSAGGRKGKKPAVSGQNYEWDNDVGWRLCKYIRSDYVDGVEFIDCKNGNGQYFNEGFQSDEFHHEGRCIAAHFGRGSNIKGKTIRRGFKHPSEQLKEWKEIAERIIK